MPAIGLLWSVVVRALGVCLSSVSLKATIHVFAMLAVVNLTMTSWTYGCDPPWVIWAAISHATRVVWL
jgi:hypothetical protein